VHSSALAYKGVPVIPRYLSILSSNRFTSTVLA
jgi:hypothetical protein